MNRLKIRNKMHQYTISKGKMIGNFEGLYKDFKDPFLQTQKEKFETSKKIITNYCEMIKNKQKKTITTLEIGCGFGKVSKDLAKLKFKSFGTDKSNTAIIKGIAKFYQSKRNTRFFKYEIY